MLVDGYNPGVKDPCRVIELIKLYDKFKCIQFAVGSNQQRIANRLGFHTSFTASVILISGWLQYLFRILLAIELTRLWSILGLYCVDIKELERICSIY